MIKRFAILALALASVAGVAAAQTPFDGQIAVPWGDWAAAALQGSGAVVLAAAGWLLRRLPGEATFMLRALRVDQLLDKAVAFGINATAGAVAGKVLTWRVGNEVLERAAEYAIKHAPQLVARLGSIDALREKIIARLQFDETTVIARVAASAPSAATAAPAPAAPLAASVAAAPVGAAPRPA